MRKIRNFFLFQHDIVIAQLRQRLLRLRLIIPSCRFLIFFVKKVGFLFDYLIFAPIFAEKYQRNDNECYNS